MRSFTDLGTLIGLVPSRIVIRLGAIDFGRGWEAFYRDQMPGLLRIARWAEVNPRHLA